MNPRTLIGLCVVAAFGGAIASGVLLSSPGTASATTPESPEYGPDSEYRSDAEISCIVHISHASVQGSNICTKDSSAKWINTETHGHEGHHDHDGHHGRDGRDGRDGEDGQNGNATAQPERCETSGMVSVQSCDMMDMNDMDMDMSDMMDMMNDSMDDNEMLNDVMQGAPAGAQGAQETVTTLVGGSPL